jgi:hypothetical protein
VVCVVCTNHQTRPSIGLLSSGGPSCGPIAAVDIFVQAQQEGSGLGTVVIGPDNNSIPAAAASVRTSQPGWLAGRSTHDTTTGIWSPPRHACTCMVVKRHGLSTTIRSGSIKKSLRGTATSTSVSAFFFGKRICFCKASSYAAAAMHRFAADRARRAVAASLRGAASRAAAAPSRHAPAPRHPTSPVGAAAPVAAAAMARAAMSTAVAGVPPPVSLDTISPKVPPVSLDTINPKVPLLCPRPLPPLLLWFLCLASLGCSLSGGQQTVRMHVRAKRCSVCT